MASNTLQFDRHVDDLKVCLHKATRRCLRMSDMDSVPCSPKPCTLTSSDAASPPGSSSSPSAAMWSSTGVSSRLS